jgi:cell division protein FtsA
MVAVGAADHEITPDDLERIKEVATLGKVPANRDILDVVPHAYKLDGQDNIKDPIGMTGTRLEIDAHVVSALTPYLVNVEKAAESAQVQPHAVVPTPVAAAKAVLSEQQRENGVAVIDFGAATTSIAVYEEGDLQYVGVVPIGSNSITNDLAIGLKTDPEIAEEVKLKHGCALGHADTPTVTVKREKEELSFSSEEINEIIEARLEEIFERIQFYLKKAGRAGKLPGGVVLVGGGSKLKHLADYAKETLGLAARLGQPAGFGVVADDIDTSSFATAIGLMLTDAEQSQHDAPRKGVKLKAPSAKDLKGKASKIFGWFKP